MESRAKLLGHPIHQMLIVFPLGLLASATVFDGIARASGNREWFDSSNRMIGAGVATGLVSAVPGLIDYLAVPSRTRAKRIGLLHGVGNVIVTGLFAASWLKRRRNPRRPSSDAVAMSVGGTVLALMTAWLGGELVDRLRVGVDEGAHLNAPNSLTQTAARDRYAA